MNLSSFPKFKECNSLVESDGTALIFNDESHHVIIFEELEWEICKLCDGSRSVNDICNQLAETYNASISDIQNDVIQFLEELQHSDLINV